jgi:hypothetical protein
VASRHYFDRAPIRVGEDREGFLSASALAVLMIGLAAVVVTFCAMLLRVS